MLKNDDKDMICSYNFKRVCGRCEHIGREQVTAFECL